MLVGDSWRETWTVGTTRPSLQSTVNRELYAEWDPRGLAFKSHGDMDRDSFGNLFLLDFKILRVLDFYLEILHTEDKDGMADGGGFISK